MSDERRRDLHLVRAFINTYDSEPYQDLLVAPEGLRAWLVENGLLAEQAEVGEPDLRAAVELREALRSMLFANNGEEIDPRAVAVLNRAAAAARLAPRFEPSGDVACLAPAAEGVDAALGTLLAVVFDAMRDGSWRRLKACRDHGCGWAFLDASKNRSRAWCSMSVCGNRAKARAHRAKARGDGEG